LFGGNKLTWDTSPETLTKSIKKLDFLGELGVHPNKSRGGEIEECIYYFVCENSKHLNKLQVRYGETRG
jgi:hypothetical protein